MKIAGTLFAACIILAILQSVVTALAIALILMLLWGVYFRPQETFGFLMFGLIVQLFEHHAAMCIAVTGVVVAVALAADRPAPP